jgi:TusE/DsrC/DsvC family sulfur relay protein
LCNQLLQAKNRHDEAVAQFIQEKLMTQFTQDAQDTETSSQHAGIRLAELIDQNWRRKKSAKLAMDEGVNLTDEHWDVIVYLRKQYLKHGLPRFARTTARALNREFAAQGGNKYLYSLFAGGPVTQGSRFANLRRPANATDVSFGTSY